MKFILIIIVKTYWLIVPKEKRRRCLFKTSCSQYVFTETKTNGLIAGLKALKYRYKNCRSGYHLHNNIDNNELEITLLNGHTVNEENISEEIIKSNTRTYWRI